MTATTPDSGRAEPPEHPCMRVDAPVCLDDVTEAARILLRRHQDNLNINWRDHRWFDDDELADRVQAERRLWDPGARWPTSSLFDDLWAQEVLLAGLAPGCAPRGAHGPDGLIAPLHRHPAVAVETPAFRPGRKPLPAHAGVPSNADLSVA